MPSWIKREWFWGAIVGVVSTISLLAGIVKAMGFSGPEARFVRIEVIQAKDHSDIGEIKTMFAKIEQELSDLKESLHKK